MSAFVPASAPKSAATVLREEGNAKYKLAMVEGLSPVIRRSRFAEAEGLYSKSLMQEQSPEERASATKNRGMTLWRLAATLSPDVATLRDLPEFLDHGVAANDALEEALRLGKAVQRDDAWAGPIYKAIEACAAAAAACLLSETKPLGLAALPVIFKLLHDYSRGVGAPTPMRCIANAAAGLVKYRDGETRLTASDGFEYRYALSRMGDCRPYLEAAISPTIDTLALQEVRETLVGPCLEDTDMTEAKSRAIREICEADVLLEKQVRGSETVDFDQVWAIADMYKQGMILTRELDLETEAKATSRLAVLYDDVLKLPMYSKRYAEQVMVLAEALAPRDVTEEEWYEAADKIYKRMSSKDEYQGPTSGPFTAEQRAALREETKQHTDPMVEITRLGVDNVTRIRKLLALLYEKHPPLNSRHKKGSVKPDKLKKTLMEALMHYHSDKQMRYRRAEDILWPEGWKWDHWFIFCEEATRHLTFFYSCTYKGS